MNKEIGPKFSIFRTCYKIPQNIIDDISEDPENPRIPRNE